MRKLYDATGKALGLGKELGSGGEGAVFVVEGQPGRVAKVYHQPIDAAKAAKIAAMASAVSPALSSIAAWPVTTLHTQPGGPLQGLLMPQVVDHREIHQLYGPAHRKREFPNADWAFLIHAARNVASAFQTIHAHGHVIADVNQGNVLVAKDGTTKLIDCDSFQIQANGQAYLCDVGVPQFTPPELQGRSYRGVTRSANHDNFGLALICFHLLFMGRHPFAGRFMGKGDMPIEKAIQEFRFAFSNSAGQRQMSPPPNALTLSVIPENLAKLFERAFGESGAQSGRPTPREWLSELEGLGRSLKTCAKTPAHKYFSRLESCPWCRLESGAGVYFFTAIASVQAGGHRLDLQVIWSKILAVPSPGNAPLPSPPSPAGLVPTPLPPELLARRNQRFRAIAVVTGIGTIAFISGLVPPLLTAALVGIWLWILTSRKVDFGDEARRRRDALQRAEGEMRHIQRRWQTEAGEAAFLRKRQELDRLKSLYQDLPDAYKREQKAALRHHYLEQHFIDRADIPGIGKSLKMTLASYGIETAADITSNAVSQVPGFGPKRTADLQIWRSHIERDFEKNANAKLSQAAIAAFESQFAKRRQDLERSLAAGAEELTQIRNQTLRIRDYLEQEVKKVAELVAQAKADVAILR